MCFRKRKDNKSSCINQKAEEVLTYVVDQLQNANELHLVNDSDDGRINSSLSENVITEFLKNDAKLQQYFTTNELILEIPKIREWYDVALYNKNLFIPINIKISSLKQSDNVSSKLGLFYTCSGINPKEMIHNVNRWPEFYKELSINTDFTKNSDYYFIIINKEKSEDVFYTSLKTLKTITPNGNNLPFQCKWGENRPENRQKNRTNKEACKFILVNFKKSLKKAAKSIKQGIRTVASITRG